MFRWDPVAEKMFTCRYGSEISPGEYLRAK
jgi:hypothetical protein